MDETEDFIHRWLNESPFDVTSDQSFEFMLNSDESLDDSNSSTLSYSHDDVQSVLSNFRFGRVSHLSSASEISVSFPNLSPVAIPVFSNAFDSTDDSEAVSSSLDVSTSSTDNYYIIDDVSHYKVPTLKSLPDFVKNFIGFHGFTTLHYAKQIISEVENGYFYGVVIGRNRKIMGLKLLHSREFIDIFCDYNGCWSHETPVFSSLEHLNDYIVASQDDNLLTELIPRPDSRLRFSPDFTFSDCLTGQTMYRGETVFFKFSIPCSRKYYQLFNEAYVLAKLNHPNIIRYIGLTIEVVSILVENAKCKFLFCYRHLNKCVGLCVGTLQTDHIPCWIKHYPDSTFKSRLLILMSVVKAMCYLKSKHVVHRNILPKNILITSSGVVKLTGFKTSAFQKPVISKFFENFPIVSRWYHCNTIVDNDGTVNENWQFKAPENLLMHEFSFQSDVYQLGMIAYFFYTAGEIPFQFCPEEVQFLTKLSLVATAYTWINFPSKDEDKLQKMFYDCLAYRPSKRPTIESVFKILKQHEPTFNVVLDLHND